jgi:nitrogenase molybdenum-iron protein alpha/beta subunit
MQLYKYFPTPSDRMGVLWSLVSIKDACVIEYGPAGTTHYASEGIAQFNGDIDAKLFTTHMDEEDIIMGDSSRLEETIREVDAIHCPRVIFVLASTISSVVGTDIERICQNLQDEISAQLIPFTGGGFRGDYSAGIREVLTALAVKIVKEPAGKIPQSYNIIGSNIDCYNFASDIKELERMMSACFGCSLNTVFTAKSSIKELEEAARAEFNLVLRSEGLDCAAVLKDKYGLNYYAGSPYGFKGTANWIKGIEKAFSIKANDIYIAQQMDKAKIYVMKVMHTAFNFEKLTAVVSGNYDFILDFYPFLAEELFIDVEKGLVNHLVRGNSRKAEGSLAGKLLFAASEDEKEELIKDIQPALLLGDGILLALGEQAPIKVQVANPNPNHYLQIYDNTPFMGFNGAIYLIEILLNQFNGQRKKLKARF